MLFAVIPSNWLDVGAKNRLESCTQREATAPAIVSHFSPGLWYEYIINLGMFFQLALT